MPTIYDAHASIINEGTADIQRLAVKITRLAGISGQEFIKTYPFLLDIKNRNIRTELETEMPPYKRNGCIGLGFTSYNHANYIQFYSTFKSFSLDIEDTVKLYFEDGTEIDLRFQYGSRSFGYMKRNLCHISNTDLDFLAKNKLVQWKIGNAQTGKHMYGGFTFQEGNEQYKSDRTGQKLFMIMAKEIGEAKKLLH